MDRCCMDVSSEDGSNSVRIGKEVEEDLEKDKSGVQEKYCRDIARACIEGHGNGHGFTHIVVGKRGPIGVG